MEQLSLLELSRLNDPACDDRTHVIRLAERVLDEIGAEPPIDVGMVASYQGVAAVKRCVLPNAGCLITDPRSGRVEIRLRARDNLRRQRFTGFHEITHTFMPGYQMTIQWRCDPSPGRMPKAEIETLCDIGASELLLPRRPVLDDLRGTDFGMATVLDLADAYDASVQATAHRVVELWPEDALLVVADVTTKPRDVTGAAPCLRVSYSAASGSWPFIWRHKSIEEDEPLGRAFAGEAVDELAPLRGICVEEVSGLHVSARLCPYTDSGGERHDRVLALYRRPAHHP